jgi:hypothetical protein
VLSRFQLASALRALGQKNEADQELSAFEKQKEQGVKQDVVARGPIECGLSSA